MSETLTYDAGTDTVTTSENLNEAEQESLEIGEEMQAQEENLLAGKYKNAEELEKAHVELQKKLGEKSDEDSEEVEEEYEEEYEESEFDGENIIEKLYEAGSNEEEISEELITELENSSPAELAKLALTYKQQASEGVTRDFSDEDVSQIQNLVGGQEAYTNMIEWAGEALPDQEVNLFDAVMEKGDPLAAYFAVQAMAYKYQDASGKDGELLTGKAPRSTADVFNSQAELVKAMEDDRYNDDPAYRQAIQQKLERSDVNF